MKSINLQLVETHAAGRMPLYWRFIAVAVLSMAVAIVGNSATSETNVLRQGANVNIQELVDEYRKLEAKAWKERRDFCIRLMDEAVISRGAKVSDIVNIFGSDAQVHEGNEELVPGGVVRFEPPSDKTGSYQLPAAGDSSLVHLRVTRSSIITSRMSISSRPWEQSKGQQSGRKKGTQLGSGTEPSSLLMFSTTWWWLLQCRCVPFF
jgi:hypothetical protein